jgi:hypothetical protein
VIQVRQFDWQTVFDIGVAAADGLIGNRRHKEVGFVPDCEVLAVAEPRSNGLFKNAAVTLIGCAYDAGCFGVLLPAYGIDAKICSRQGSNCFVDKWAKTINETFNSHWHGPPSKITNPYLSRVADRLGGVSGRMHLKSVPDDVVGGVTFFHTLCEAG